jgi:hypothetical protein
MHGALPEAETHTFQLKQEIASEKRQNFLASGGNMN